MTHTHTHRERERENFCDRWGNVGAIAVDDYVTSDTTTASYNNYIHCRYININTQ